MYMNKLAKTIIGVLAGIIIILIVVIIILATSKNNENKDISNDTNNDEIKQLAGVYTHTTTNNSVATIILNDDMTCRVDDRNECKWTLSEDKKEIIITQATYQIAFDKCSFKDEDGGLSSIGDSSATKEECEKKLNEYKEKYIMVNPRCEYDTNIQPRKATIINGGFIINNKLTYYKVG